MKDSWKSPHSGFKFPGSYTGMFLFNKFSVVEKAIFFVFFTVFVASALSLAWNVNEKFLVKIPARGGSLSEGIVGTPRFINPVLALSEADRDLTALMYSGLVRHAEDGELEPDLALDYTISSNGLVYTFVLNEKAVFHDGKPVTADDVEFTIQRAQDPIIKSPKRGNWDGITLEKVSSHEIKFILKKPYAPFLENATIGILPRHIWKDVDTEQFTFSLYNTEPIGTGPYRLKSIKRDRGGLPQSYELVPFDKYTGTPARITTLLIKFFSNEKSLTDAYKSQAVDSIHSISPKDAQALKRNDSHIKVSPLPRVFGIFFNQSSAPVFVNAEVRSALNIAAPKKQIVDEVLYGYGTPINSPIPPGLIEGIGVPSIDKDSEESVFEAIALLEKNGWKRNKDGIMEKKSKTSTQTLQFTIATLNAPELRQSALIVQNAWKKIGADVTVETYDLGDLNMNIIRPRKYDALLFGEIIGRDLDLYAFWHSSQRKDPGLNIALYVNSKTDKLLEDARTLSDTEARNEKYRAFNDILMRENPAVFLYSPDFIYAMPEKVKGFTLNQITTPSDRYTTITEWHINTDKVWKIFANELHN